MYAWIPGTAMGVLCGALAPMAASYARRGKYRGLILNTVKGLIVISLLFWLSGGAAYFAGQPYHVWYPLLLTGVVITFPVIFAYRVFRQVYTMAELKKMHVEDMK